MEIARFGGIDAPCTLAAVSDQNTYVRFWEEAAVQLLHPTQLLIVEALTHLECPVSASAMGKMADGQIKLSLLSYHCNRLTELGLLEPCGRAQRRGATERFYRLRHNGRG